MANPNKSLNTIYNRSGAIPVDVWKMICENLDFPDLKTLSIVDKKFNAISTNEIQNKAIGEEYVMLSEENIMHIVTLSFKMFECVDIGDPTNHDSPNYQFEYDENLVHRESYEADYMDDEADHNDFESNQKMLDDVYEVLRGNKRLIIPLKLTIYNKMGINDDDRGTRDPSIEFELFNGSWSWAPGIYTINEFIQGLWQLKSHKFENWYEGIWGLNKLKHCACGFCGDKQMNDTYFVDDEIVAQVSGDHGS